MDPGHQLWMHFPPSHGHEDHAKESQARRRSRAQACTRGSAAVFAQATLCFGFAGCCPSPVLSAGVALHPHGFNRTATTSRTAMSRQQRHAKGNLAGEASARPPRSSSASSVVGMDGKRRGGGMPASSLSWSTWIQFAAMLEFTSAVIMPLDGASMTTGISCCIRARHASRRTRASKTSTTGEEAILESAITSKWETLRLE
mmetsp:Transcript_110683/g.344914  ORF Transcript_110683/g.344914 Transcript_110683/m.344914 type:complete len:201 (-) Transcript_110683:78-680(-)